MEGSGRPCSVATAGHLPGSGDPPGFTRLLWVLHGAITACSRPTGHFWRLVWLLRAGCFGFAIPAAAALPSVSFVGELLSCSSCSRNGRGNGEKGVAQGFVSGCLGVGFPALNVAVVPWLPLRLLLVNVAVVGGLDQPLHRMFRYMVTRFTFDYLHLLCSFFSSFGFCWLLVFSHKQSSWVADVCYLFAALRWG